MTSPSLARAERPIEPCLAMAQDPKTRPPAERSPAELAQQGRASQEIAPAETAPAELGSLLAPGVEAPARRRPAPAPTRLPSAATAEPTPHATFLARRHFAALDGLRAIGILAVVWHHTAGGPGRLGANLFFLLSGFLVTTVLLRERARKDALDVLGFRVRRARRLYPLYFTVLAGYVALVGLLEPAGPTRSDFFEHLPAFATFTSNWFVDLQGERTIFYFAWSLAAQEQFYLVWPWVLQRARVATCVRALIGLLATVYLTRAGGLDFALPSGSLGRTLVLSACPALALGALLALTLHSPVGFRRVWSLLGGRWTSAVLLLAALGIWRTPSIPEPFMHAVLTALTAACVLREDHWLARLLRLPAIVHVGVVSYGIYLLHMLCHNAVERGLAVAGLTSGPLDFVCTALLAIGVATLSQRHFESRFLSPEKRAKLAQPRAA